MFTARTLTRALRTSAARTLTSTVAPRAVLTSTWKSSTFTAPRTAAFSTSLRFAEKLGSVDEELALKLQSELELENESKETDDYPVPVQEFLGSSEFKVTDKPGQEEVELTRKFGDETIRIIFSVSDLNAISEEMNDDSLYDDEHAEDGVAPQSGGAQSKQAKESGAVENDEEFDGDDEIPSFPARLNITIEKPNAGALQVEAVAQDGMVVIDNVFFHKSAKLATSQTAEADWERRGVYAGPPFGNLDEDLQTLLERYLDERGINTSLALFVPEYIDYKEQKEYLSWLSNVKGFVEA